MERSSPSRDEGDTGPAPIGGGGGGREPPEGARPALVLWAGMAALFVELTFIRYVPGQIRVLGYFTNFVLLAAFLGLGVGMLAARKWPRRRALCWLAPWTVLLVVALAEVGVALHVLPSPEDFLFLQYTVEGHEVAIHLFLFVAFAIVATCFVPLGRVVGWTLEGDRPLLRYGLNVAGSLLGIGLFVVLSAWSVPPFAWILLSGLLALVGLVRAPRLVQALSGVAVVAAALWAHHATGGSLWSPYQKVSVAPCYYHPERGLIREYAVQGLAAEERRSLRQLDRESCFVVRVNDDSYQLAVDLGDAALEELPALEPTRAQYDLAFRVPDELGSVLVLGAGTGNDVAAALRLGATHVDAVEIDPIIVELGGRHPERPYSDPRVTVHVEDARTYLARTDRRYDLILFALVDSHVLQSHRSNVRLDSYVFTEESFRLARDRLEPNGFLVLSHAVGQPWFLERMRATLARAFGRPPVLLSDRLPHRFGNIFVSGDLIPPGRAASPDAVPLEDDWPFVYLRSRTIPTDYLIAMLLMALVAVAGSRLASSHRFTDVDPHFFALGAGFMLLETRGIGVLSLLVGSTWGVNAAIFAGVLTMALLATVTAARLPRIRPVVAYAVLFATLAAGFVIPLSSLSGQTLPLRAILGVLLLSVPLFASGIVFALSLARSRQTPRALASNLLGALAGGLVEYLSMVVGFRYLLVLAALFYLVALLTQAKPRELV